MTYETSTLYTYAHTILRIMPKQAIPNLYCMSKCHAKKRNW